MQRLATLRLVTATRFSRVLNLKSFESEKTNFQVTKRFLSNTPNSSKDDKHVDTHADLYKPSTEKEETDIPDNLIGSQPKETINTNIRIPPKLTGGGKVWSAQNPGSVHIAPLGATKTTYIPPTTESGQTSPIDGSPLNSSAFSTTESTTELTPGQLAEAAAASAFQPFPPDSPVTPPSTPVENIFAPKISSTDLYSNASSPTAHFEQVIPNSASETTTSADESTSKFSKTTTNQTESTKEIPIQREGDIRDEILREALKHVEDKGWTMEAIRSGIRSSQQPSTVEGLFSNGYDLVEYFMRDANGKMSQFMNEKRKSGDVQGGRLLIEGLKYRLGLVVPFARTWDQALAQGALPQNAVRGWKNLLDLSSDAWNGIGDTTTDINWYTKRLVVAAIYKSAEIFMLQDQSVDKIETINFLERRLSDFQTIGSVKNSVSKSLSDTAQLASGLFSVVRNMTSRR